MLALAKLVYITWDEKYTKVAYQAFLYEEYFFDEELQDWEDLRGKEPAGRKEQGGIKSDKKETENNRFKGIGWEHFIASRVYSNYIFCDLNVFCNLSKLKC